MTGVVADRPACIELRGVGRRYPGEPPVDALRDVDLDDRRRASCSRSSGRRGPARRRCSTCSARSTGRRAARSRSPASASTACRTGRCPRCGRGGSGSCSSTSTCWAASRRSTTSPTGCSTAGCPGGTGGARRPAALDRVGLGASGPAPPGPAVGRRAAAGRGRAGARRPAGDRPRRRADRQPRLGDRRRARRPVPGPQRDRRRDDRGHHPRPRPGGVAAASGRAARRPDRRGPPGSRRWRRDRGRARRVAGAALVTTLVAHGPGPIEVGRIARRGLGARTLRSALTAVGIAIGIAAMVAVLAISDASRASLLAVLDRLGTNMLTVAPGQSFLGDDIALPDDARGDDPAHRPGRGRERRRPCSQTVGPPDRPDRRRRRPAACRSRPSTRRCSTRSGARSRIGRFLDAALERYPAVVLGAVAAQRLGIYDLDAPVQVFIGGRWFTRRRHPRRRCRSRPELDRAALIGPDGRRDVPRRRRLPDERLRPRGPGARRRGPGGPRRHGQPGAARGGQRPAAVGRDRGQGRRGDRVHRAVPRARRGRARRSGRWASRT